MKKIVAPISSLVFFFAIAWPADARNDTYILKIDAALQAAAPAEKPDGSIKFFFAKQETPKVATTIGNWTAHERTRANPSIDVKACNAAFLLALAALHKRAKQMGANAVINIASYYKKNELENRSEFECHAGAAAHVMLRGEFVKIAD